jgi:DMATS type aromatic prenyltransferase
VTETSIVSSETLAQRGSARLRALCRALGYDALETRAAESLFEVLAASWGKRAVDEPPTWASDITDDHTPYEFSLAVDGRAAELRFLIEVQGARPSLTSNWAESRAMNERLAAEHGAHLGRLAAVEDLFAPSRASRFAMWHAVCLRPGEPPDFKVYLDPQAHGAAEARWLVETAMQRLGLGDARAHLPAIGAGDELCYVSLDLSATPASRIKIYTAHHHASVARIEAAIASAEGYTPGQVLDFCQLVGASKGPFRARPVQTCLAFVQGKAAPITGTVHFPIRSYVHDDRVAADRILRCMGPESASIYVKALEAFADRRLEDGTGMQTYVSLRLERGRRRLNVYLAPQIYTRANPDRATGDTSP